MKPHKTSNKKIEGENPVSDVQRDQVFQESALAAAKAYEAAAPPEGTPDDKIDEIEDTRMDAFRDSILGALAVHQGLDQDVLSTLLGRVAA